jgi:hypothetical protein
MITQPQSTERAADPRQHSRDPHAELRRLNARIRSWNNPRPIPINALRPGVVVWAEIPFADDDAQSKGRPSVVIDVRDGVVEVLPITSSSARLRRPTVDVELTGWEQAGLSRPSAARRTVVRVARCKVSEILGELTLDDAQIVLRSRRSAAA